MKRIILSVLLILCFSVVASHAEEFGEVDIHGFIAQGFMQSDENKFFANTKKGTFEFNEMGINFSTDLTNDLRVGMQFFARDLGEFGNDEIAVDWVFADYHYKPWLGIRMGKMKVPFGLYNETRDVDMLRTTILLPQGVYNEGWRDTISSIKGSGLYGAVPLGPVGGFIYNIQTGIMDIPTEGGIGKFAQDQGDQTANVIDPETAFIGSLLWETPLEGLRIGVTISKVDFDIASSTNDGPLWRYRSIVAAMGGSTTAADAAIAGAGGSIDAVYGAGVQGSAADLVGLNLDFPIELLWSVYSVEYVWNNLTIAGEYSMNNADYNLAIAGTSTMLVQDTELKIEGYYGSVSYRFTDLFELGLYYSEFYPDADDKDGLTLPELGYPKEAGWSKDICLSTRFDLNESWVIKVEGHLMDGLAVMFMSDQDRIGTGYDVDEDWFLGAVKFSYSF